MRPYASHPNQGVTPRPNAPNKPAKMADIPRAAKWAALEAEWFRKSAPIKMPEMATAAAVIAPRIKAAGRGRWANGAIIICNLTPRLCDAGSRRRTPKASHFSHQLAPTPTCRSRAAAYWQRNQIANAATTALAVRVHYPGHTNANRPEVLSRGL